MAGTSTVLYLIINFIKQCFTATKFVNWKARGNFSGVPYVVR